VLNAIFILLRAVIAVYTVYNFYFSIYFDSTSPLNRYLEVVRSVVTKYISFCIYIVSASCCMDTSLSRVSLAYFTVSVFHCLRRFTIVKRVIIIILAAFSYYLSNN
jgi:hypothetical protein